jgi:hypothetical protein
MNVRSRESFTAEAQRRKDSAENFKSKNIAFLGNCFPLRLCASAVKPL